MNRREFLKCSGACAGAGVTGFSLAGPAVAGQQAPSQPPTPASQADPRAQQMVRARYRVRSRDRGGQVPAPPGRAEVQVPGRERDDLPLADGQHERGDPRPRVRRDDAMAVRGNAVSEGDRSERSDDRVHPLPRPVARGRGEDLAAAGVTQDGGYSNTSVPNLSGWWNVPRTGDQFQLAVRPSS